MSNSFDGISKLFVFGVIIVALIFIHFWYVILPVIGVTVGAYLYYKYQNNLKQEKERIEKEKRKRIRDERIRKEKLEKERIQRRIEEEIKKEQERIKQEKAELVELRLKKFKISKKEAELIFGRTWEKRFEKPDELFIKEIVRVAEKITESVTYKQKIALIMEKVFDIIDVAMHEIWGKIQNWDDIDYENWEEDWDEVRETWRKEKHHYQRYENARENNYAKYYAILGLKVNSTIKEIKAQYRKLMLKFHPDKNTSPDAEKKCREIMDAYNKLMEMIQN